MRPLFVICCVGLSPSHIGRATPRLKALAEQGFAAPLASVVPAVTTTAQTTMLTGVAPREHGIVGNGWYFRELGEVWLWRQSEKLLDAPPIWEKLRARGRQLRVLKHFWWYAMNSSADVTITPRPAYHADGRKSPDFYTSPPDLHDRIAERHGPFPLFDFWGPTASIKSTRWIADSFATADELTGADLSLCYLPHLDYDLQRFGPEGPHLDPNLRALDACVGTILDHAEQRRAAVLVVSEYGIEAVSDAVYINRHLREAGLLAVTTNATGELLDPGASRAFAVVDHQLAHVYCADEAAVKAAMEALRGKDGIDRLYVGAERAELELDHPRSGEIVALAAPGWWLTYDYWLDPRLRPDFANQVEIHKKPGYDPRELFFDPRGGKRRAVFALLRKKLGFRYVLDPVPLDPSLVAGSHGRRPSSPEHGAIVIGSDAAWRDRLASQEDVAPFIAHAMGA